MLKIKSQGSMRETSLIAGLVLRFFDVFFIVASARFAYNLYFETWGVPEHYRLVYTAAALCVISFFPLLGVYRLNRGNSRLDEVWSVFVALSALFLMLALAAVLSKTSESYSRVWFVLWYICSLTSFGFCRLVFHTVLRLVRSRGFDQKKIALIGTTEQVERVVEALANNDWSGLVVRRIFLLKGEDLSSLKTHIPICDLDKNTLHNIEFDVDEIWLSLPISRAEELKDLMDDLSSFAKTIRYAPDFFGIDLINHSVSQIGDLPIVNLSVTPMEGWNKVLKWCEDVFLASLILILISPVMLLIAIGVKMSSPGPVFYKQERVSWSGRRFKMYKFRSMPVDLEKNNGVEWGNAGSKSVTSFGRFIRSTSLDELPQFINVLFGDMSIVGPRPERTVFVEQFKTEIPRYMQKHMVKAGITGWAQIHGWRGDTDLTKRIEFDMYYIENWSIILDLKIIAMTVFKGFVHKNAK